MTEVNDTGWEDIDTEGRETAAMIFDALERSDQVRRSLDPEQASREKEPASPVTASPVTASRLWAFAVSGAARPDATLAAGLMRNPALRQDLARMMDRTAVSAIPRAAAAATGARAADRVAGGYRVRLIESRSDTADVYLIISVPDGAETPSTLRAMTADGEIVAQDLSFDGSSEAQILLAADHPVVRAVADPETQIWLA